jgi:hypothetical protein
MLSVVFWKLFILWFLSVLGLRKFFLPQVLI